MMKKLLASVFALLLMLLSVSVYADPVPISATNGSALPGGSVTLIVKNDGVDMSDGAAFRVAFTDTRLKSPVFLDAGDFILFSVDVPLGGDVFLACGLGCQSGDVFSLTLSIAGNATPGAVVVNYDWYGLDIDFQPDSLLGSVSSIVTILDSQQHGIPEPGALALVGVALLIMVGTSRRRRVSRP